MRRDLNLNSVHKSLESSFMNVPEPLDSEKPKYYVPKNPFPTPAYYPQSPASHFDNPALYAKFDVETLFYIFYYQQGTYHQYLAAKELKKQSWRFHKQYLTWFQRHSEPQAITDEYEQGVYVYFDWEGSWCQRKKSDFRYVNSYWLNAWLTLRTHVTDARFALLDDTGSSTDGLKTTSVGNGAAR